MSKSQPTASWYLRVVDYVAYQVEAPTHQVEAPTHHWLNEMKVYATFFGTEC